MTIGGKNSKVVSQIFVDRFCLGWRLNNDDFHALSRNQSLNERMIWSILMPMSNALFATLPPKASLIIDIQTSVTAGIIVHAPGKFEFQKD